MDDGGLPSSLRTAVVVAREARDSWGEAAGVTRRIAGTLAHARPLDVLVARDAPRVPTTHEPPLRFRSFASFTHRASQSILDARREPRTRSPWEEISATLVQQPPEIVVTLGCPTRFLASLATRLPASSRIWCAPFACQQPDALALLDDPSFVARVERILVFSSTELDLVRRACISSPAARLVNVNFALRVHPLAAQMPLPGDSRPSILVVADWRASASDPRLLAQAELLATELPSVGVHLIGPGAEGVRPGKWANRIGISASMDLWRWMAGATAVIDLAGDGPLATRTLEALLLQVPVLAPVGSVAARGHLEHSSGGFVFNAYQDLVASIRTLIESTRGRELARRGHDYAVSHYGNATTFCEALLADFSR